MGIGRGRGVGVIETRGPELGTTAATSLPSEGEDVISAGAATITARLEATAVTGPVTKATNVAAATTVRTVLII